MVPVFVREGRRGRSLVINHRHLGCTRPPMRNIDGDSEPAVKAILSLLEKLLISALALVREGGRGICHIIHGPVGVHITVVDILVC